MIAMPATATSSRPMSRRRANSYEMVSARPLERGPCRSCSAADHWITYRWWRFSEGTLHVIHFDANYDSRGSVCEYGELLTSPTSGPLPSATLRLMANVAACEARSASAALGATASREWCDELKTRSPTTRGEPTSHEPSSTGIGQQGVQRSCRKGAVRPMSAST